MKFLLLLLTLLVTIEAKPPLPSTDELFNLSNQSFTSQLSQLQRQLHGEGISPLQLSQTDSEPSATNFNPFQEDTTEKPSRPRARSVDVSSQNPNETDSTPAPYSSPPAFRPDFQFPLSSPMSGPPYKVTFPIPLPKPLNGSYSNDSFIYPLVIGLTRVNLPRNFYPSNLIVKSIINRPGEPSEYSLTSGNGFPIRLPYRPPFQQPRYEPAISYRTMKNVPRSYQPQYVSRPGQSPLRNPYYPPLFRVTYPPLARSDIYAVRPDYIEPQTLTYGPQSYQESPRASYNGRSSYGQAAPRIYKTSLSEEMAVDPLTGEIIQEANAPSRYYRSYNYLTDNQGDIIQEANAPSRYYRSYNYLTDSRGDIILEANAPSRYYRSYNYLTDNQGDLIQEANAPSRYYRSYDSLTYSRIEPYYYVRQTSPFHPIFEEQ